MKKDIWTVWPTVHKEQTNKMIDVWHEKGYGVGVLVNLPMTNDMFEKADVVIVQNQWEGFPVAVNLLCENVFGDIVVVAGDDIYPDPDKTADEIAEIFLEKFPDTFGVMQPTGDKFGDYDKCAVSPWIGKKFIEKAYEGNGPYWEEYFHYFSDRELQEYAIKMEAFFQCKDITQYHDHWQRKENPKRPEHLMKAKNRWHADQRIYKQRLIKGFPNGTD